METGTASAIRKGEPTSFLQWRNILTRLVLYAPWHFLYFFPLPQGQGSLRPTLSAVRCTG